jgi:uncharacterized protein (DUF885 family)
VSDQLEPTVGPDVPGHPIHAIADRFVDEYAAQVPIAATFVGVPGHDDRWGDLGPEGQEQLADLLRRTLAAIDACPPPADRWDELGMRTLREQVELELADHDAGEHGLDVAHLGSTVPTLRETLEAQDASSDEGREALARRLETYGEALDGWRRRIAVALDAGDVVARRQVESVIAQLRSAVDDRGGITRLARDVARRAPQLAGRLDRALDAARRDSEEVAGWLEEAYLPKALERDGVGPERYARAVRRELRSEVDPDEATAWAWDRIREDLDRARRVAAEIDPDLPLPEVMQRLKTEPDFAAPSPEAFRDLMLERQRTALDALADTHFHVPDEIRDVQVSLASPGSPLGAWYFGPSEDLRRPGAIWWSLGDKQQVPLYEEVSTAYHEGFPGHHLQVGIQVTLGDRLTRAHRLLLWNPGYGEGWALYAEQLMDELGYLERPEYVLGYLTSSLLRSVRVVADLGCHLGLRIPDDAPFRPGAAWSYDLAVAALEELAYLDHDYAVSEATRYLGLPAQAISYALGRRRILELRDERRRREGPDFDLVRFHADVLGSGSVGLDHLRELVLADPAPAR